MEVIPQSTIDEAMLYIIEYYESAPTGHYITDQSLVYQGICDQLDVKHLISVLEGRGLISYAPSRFIPAPHIQLLDKGKSYLEDSKAKHDAETKESFRFWLSLLKDILIFIAGAALEGKFGVLRNLFSRL